MGPTTEQPEGGASVPGYRGLPRSPAGEGVLSLVEVDRVYEVARRGSTWA